MRTITVGTRGSALAVAQTRQVVAALKEEWAELNFKIVTIRTSGDTASAGPDRFVKELEAALLARQIDMAVHSLKDVPTKLPEGLALGAISRRLEARDALISRGELPLAQLPPGSAIGSSSPRRRAQLLAARPDLVVQDLRGNIDSRLSALARGDYDAIVLAAAGLYRMEWRNRITELLSTELMLPAPGQGCLAIEVQAEDDLMLETVYPTNDRPSELCAQAERGFLAALGTGCDVPVGALAHLDGEQIFLEGVVASLDGKKLVRRSASGPTPQEVGRELAEEVLGAGGAQILEVLGARS